MHSEVPRNSCLIVQFRWINYDKCKPISLYLSLPACLCQCLLGFVQLLRNRWWEPAGCSNRSASQRIRGWRTRPTYWDNSLQVAVSPSPSPRLIYTHTLPHTHTHTRTEILYTHAEESASVMFDDQGVTYFSRPWIDSPLFCFLFFFLLFFFFELWWLISDKCPIQFVQKYIKACYCVSFMCYLEMTRFPLLENVS